MMRPRSGVARTRRNQVYLCYGYIPGATPGLWLIWEPKDAT